MPNRNHILNESRGIRLSYDLAVQAVEACACKWVIKGRTIRNLTPDEAKVARKEQAERALSDRTPFELPKLIFTPPEYAQAATRNELRVARDADRFMVRAWVKEGLEQAGARI